MTEKFINPYQFVPLTQMQAAKLRSEVIQTLVEKPGAEETFAPQVQELLHDRYPVHMEDGVRKQTTYSGHITCELTTVSPGVFGNRHRKVKFGNGSDDTTSIVDNLSIEGKAAIAGTALKGMLSTLAEMASGSAMRILKKRAMSIRSAMRQSRSAVGMIIEVGDGKEKQRMLLPLTLPNFSETGGKWRPAGQGGSISIWEQLIQRRNSLVTMPVYIARNPPQETAFHSKFPIVELINASPTSVTWKKNVGVSSAPESCIKTEKGRKTLRPMKGGRDQKVRLRQAESNAHPGIVRSLQNPGGKKKSDGQKLADPWFSLFIPIEESWCSTEGHFNFEAVDPALLLSAEDACRVFDAIVADPFSTAPGDPDFSATALSGQSRFRLPKKKGRAGNKGLKQGDLVYFEPHENPGTQEIEVKSLSISSIWREGVRWLWEDGQYEPENQQVKGGDYSLFNQNSDQVPMNPHRTQLTIAEKLFGWVMDGVKEKAEQKPDDLPNAYRGRVRISDAVSKSSITDVLMSADGDSKQVKSGTNQKPTDPLAGLVPLKILSTPRLPCPEFYFTGGGNTIRSALFNGKKSVRMQGWKFYVVNPATLNRKDSAAWKTSNEVDMNQKSWVRPIRPGTEFRFRVDFDNLTKEELQLLCYCLRPADNFYHRVGFGKPLGLGAVQIVADTIQVRDNASRWATEKDLLGFGGPTFRQMTVNDFAVAWAERIGQQARLIEKSGTPVQDSVNVNYPFVVEVNKFDPSDKERQPELRLYNWFVANRGRTDEVIQPLQPLSTDAEFQAFEVPHYEVKPVQQNSHRQHRPTTENRSKQKGSNHKASTGGRPSSGNPASQPVIQILANQHEFTTSEMPELTDFVRQLSEGPLSPLKLEFVTQPPSNWSRVRGSTTELYVGFPDSPKGVACRTIRDTAGKISPATNWIRLKVETIRNPPPKGEQ